MSIQIFGGVDHLSSGYCGREDLVVIELLITDKYLFRSQGVWRRCSDRGNARFIIKVVRALALLILVKRTLSVGRGSYYPFGRCSALCLDEIPIVVGDRAALLYPELQTVAHDAGEMSSEIQSITLPHSDPMHYIGITMDAHIPLVSRRGELFLIGNQTNKVSRRHRTRHKFFWTSMQAAGAGGGDQQPVFRAVSRTCDEVLLDRPPQLGLEGLLSTASMRHKNRHPAPSRAHLTGRHRPPPACRYNNRADQNAPENVRVPGQRYSRDGTWPPVKQSVVWAFPVRVPNWLGRRSSPRCVSNAIFSAQRRPAQGIEVPSPGANGHVPIELPPRPGRQQPSFVSLWR
jgi:hypothetical protein